MILLGYANMLALGNMNRNRPRQKPVDPGKCIRFALPTSVTTNDCVNDCQKWKKHAGLAAGEEVLPGPLHQGISGEF
jgi:hypothetical protein